MDLTEDEFPVWWGAVLDSEGYVGWDGTARIQVTSTHRPTLELLQRRLGGTVRRLQVVPGQKKTRFQLGLTGPAARSALAVALPYIYEKRPQVELILALTPVGGRRRLTDHDRELRARTQRELKQLRHAT